MTTELEKAELKLKQAQERVKQIKSRQRDRDRKADTRRKVLLGALLLNKAQAGGPERNQVLKLIDQLDDRNKALFEDLRKELAPW